MTRVRALDAIPFEKELKFDMEVWHWKERKVEATGALDLGVLEPKNGYLILRAEVVGGHERSEGSKSFFGLDCVVLEEVN